MNNKEDSKENLNNQEPVIISAKPNDSYEQEPTNNTKPVNNINSSESKQKDSKKLDKKKLTIIGIVIIVIIVLIFLGLMFFLSKPNNSSKEDTSLESAFFIYDNKEAILFNTDGKQLVKDKFIYQENFVNGSTLVKLDQNKAGIISENGKMLVDYGVYDSIYHHGPLYIAYKEKEKTYNLLDSKGKVILTGKQLQGYNAIDASQFMLLKDDSKFTIYDIKGKAITTFPFVKDIEEPTLIERDDYLTVNYNNKTYIVKANSNLVETLDGNFYIDQVGKNVVILISILQDSPSFKVIINDKLAYSKEVADLELKGNNVLSEGHLLDDKGNIISNDIVSYIDNKNYAVSAGEDTIELRVNNKTKATVKCFSYLNDRYSSTGIYLFDYCNEKEGYFYYKADGTLLNKEPFRTATQLDSEGVAIVSNMQDEYFLINKNIKKVSKNYKEIITMSPGIYKAKSQDDSEIVLNKEGKELFSGTNIEIIEDKYATYLDKESVKRYVYDLENERVVVTLPKADYIPSFYDYYFKTFENSKEQYYLYKTGKIFYETKEVKE